MTSKSIIVSIVVYLFFSLLFCSYGEYPNQCINGISSLWQVFDQIDSLEIIDRQKVQKIIEEIPESLEFDTARVLSIEGLNDAEAELVLKHIKDKFPEAYQKEGFIVYGSGNAYSIMVGYLDYISGLSDFNKKVLAKKYITDLAEHKTLIKGSTHIPRDYSEEQIKGIGAIYDENNNSIVFFQDSDWSNTMLFHETAHLNYNGLAELTTSIYDEGKSIPSKYTTLGFRHFLLNEYLAYKKGERVGDAPMRSDRDIIDLITQNPVYKNTTSEEDKNNFLELSRKAEENKRSLLQQLLVEIDVYNKELPQDRVNEDEYVRLNH